MGVSSRRTVILIAAVVVAILAGLLVYNYVNSADERAQGNARRVSVLVVKADIPRGTSGREAQTKGLIKSAEIQSEFKPPTAVNNVAIIADKVAVADLAAGQVLVDNMFADPVESQITFAGRVPDQCGPVDAVTKKPVPCVAITKSFDNVRGVAGVIVPGDFVNILVLSTGENPQCKADAAAQPGVVPPVFCKPARYLFESVQVLFVDRSAVPQPGEATATSVPGQVAANQGLITFAVPAKAAQILASLQDDQLVLTLLPPSYQPVPLPPFDSNVKTLPAEDPAQLTPYGPQGIQTK